MIDQSLISSVCPFSDCLVGALMLSPALSVLLMSPACPQSLLTPWAWGAFPLLLPLLISVFSQCVSGLLTRKRDVLLRTSSASARLPSPLCRDRTSVSGSLWLWRTLELSGFPAAAAPAVAPAADTDHDKKWQMLMLGVVVLCAYFELLLCLSEWFRSLTLWTKVPPDSWKKFCLCCCCPCVKHLCLCLILCVIVRYCYLQLL